MTDFCNRAAFNSSASKAFVDDPLRILMVLNRTLKSQLGKEWDLHRRR
ncbi:tail component [Salmonella phage 19]|nr:tail component [Salmonella phage 19]